MTRKTLILAYLIFLTGLSPWPRSRVDACTTTPTPTPTWTYTPTATATDVPPGVTPAPSLTPTPSLTPVPTLTYEQRFYDQASVVFRGVIWHVEKQGEWDESVLVRVQEYYKGGGGSFAHVGGLMTFRLCNSFASERGAESVYYVTGGYHGTFYPVAIMGSTPEGIASHSPRGMQIGFGWLETAVLGLSAMGGALMIAWMVRPRR